MDYRTHPLLPFLEQSQTPLALLHEDGTLLAANAPFCSATGMQAGAFGSSGPDLTDGAGELWQTVTQALSQAAASRLHADFVWDRTPIIRGRVICLHNAPCEKPTQEPPPEQTYMVELGMERSLRLQAERHRRRERQLFFDVIEELPLFVYMQRRDYTVAYANRATEEYYGEARGRRCYEVFVGRDSPCPHCPTFRVFDTGTPVDWQFTDKDGRTFHIYDYPFEDEDGEPLVMELGVDITELKRVERKLFSAQKMRAIGVLAGGIAHDLNNNLVPIIFNIEHELSTLATSSEEASATPLGEALRAAYRAAELVEQVLEYSRQQNVSRSTIRLTPLARENLELLRASLPGHIHLTTHYEADNDCIHANPSQMQQVFLNLCRNAAQAMPDGGTIDVRLSNRRISSRNEAPHPDLALGEHVVIEVTDTGHGMPPEALDRIFEPFYTSKKKSGGTGMGLAVVHSIIRCSDGYIDVASTEGRGSTFTIHLPCTTAEVKTAEGTPPHKCISTGRILLVDDDFGALRAMQRVLRDAGYQVFTADDGEKGLQEFYRGKGRYDLVLTDQSMLQMTGMEMAEHILTHNPEARVVICTGHVEDNLERAANRAGVAGFILKPMSPRKLLEHVAHHLGVR